MYTNSAQLGLQSSLHSPHSTNELEDCASLIAEKTKALVEADLQLRSIQVMLDDHADRLFGCPNAGQQANTADMRPKSSGAVGELDGAIARIFDTIGALRTAANRNATLA